MRRRLFIRSTLFLMAAPPARSMLMSESARDLGRANRKLKVIEKRVGGRLGVAAIETRSGKRLLHRADERFPMCSTFKWMLAAHVLARVDRGEETLERQVKYGHDDLLDYAPITREHVDEGSMSVSDLCAAAIQLSDNTAANLLLASSGGPAGLTSFLRDLGDDKTWLDRTEPDLNMAVPGDPRDTSTPLSTALDLERVVLGPVLTDESRMRLVEWMVGNKTGGARLRAGMPAGWRIGDKTGTCGYGSTNDVAVVWPNDRAPIVIAAYLTESRASDTAREQALAAVGRVVAEWVEE